MKKIELEVYSTATNSPVVRMPDRRFPGIVIQGDTLVNLQNLAKSIHEKTKHTNDSELIDESEELASLLKQFVLHYEFVLREHEILLPYFQNDS